MPHSIQSRPHAKAKALPAVVMVPLILTALIVTSVTMTTVTDAYVDKIRASYNAQQVEACHMREARPIYDATGLMVGCSDGNDEPEAH